MTDDATLESINDETNFESNVERKTKLTNRYVLSPRSTRGIPPKRYDPDYESKRSRYSVDRSNNECLK